MHYVQDTVDLYELAKLAGNPQGLVRGVIDIRNGHMALDAELHADAAQFLIELGSHPDDIWGFNLFPDKFGTPAFIELNAPINVKPQQHNRALTIEDDGLRDRLTTLITKKVLRSVGAN
jgi:hypothetical protein